MTALIVLLLQMQCAKHDKALMKEPFAKENELEQLHKQVAFFTLHIYAAAAFLFHPCFEFEPVK